MPAAAGANAGASATTYDGVAAPELAARLDVPRVHLFDAVGSTMDIAHDLASQGAPSGTVVLAESQESGRGRQGRVWRSAPGQGIWATIIERPADASGLEVLSLRAGLLLAEALDALAGVPVRLKWPNDLYAGVGKLAGILIEARWRSGALEWLAVGVGLNVRPPSGGDGAGLSRGARRLDALAHAVAAVRTAAATVGGLSPGELARFHARDLAVGRPVVSPSSGVVAGVDASGAVVIVGPHGARPFRAGSLVFAEDA